MIPNTPKARMERKRQLTVEILSLEQMINLNQHDAKLLSELRADYRHAIDELALYYDDDPTERVIKP